MQFVFSTSQVKRYRFPTHINDLVLDRSAAATSEVFIVVLEPGESPPLHQHDDTEQIFYVLEGVGTLTVRTDAAEHATHTVQPGDVVRIPPATLHSIEASAGATLRYLAIDCFVQGRPTAEPTWESHVKVMCQQQGWDFDQIVQQ
ncbi:MAG TPA: cupin domain-containing protein [Abditibacteriaceae bacterium]|nr:cupin domain-containing protein [Abditibacteriaceae bacterium]